MRRAIIATTPGSVGAAAVEDDVDAGDVSGGENQRVPTTAKPKTKPKPAARSAFDSPSASQTAKKPKRSFPSERIGAGRRDKRSVPRVAPSPDPAAGASVKTEVSVPMTKSMPGPTSVQSADFVDVAAVSAVKRPPAKTATTTLLSVLGFSPLVTGGPSDLPDSLAAWAVFAALRRQTEEDTGTEQRVLSVADPVVATLGVEDDAQPMMMAMAAAVNSVRRRRRLPGCRRR